MARGIAGVGRRAGGAERGTAALELVLILPLLLGLLAVIVDLGRLVADYHAVSKSVRDSVRYLTRAEAGVGGLAIDCAAGTLDAGSIVAQDAVRLALTGRIDGNPATDALVAGWRTPGVAGAAVAIAVECRDNSGRELRGLYANADRISAMVVSATVPFRFSFARLIGLGPALDFTVTRRMAHMGT